MPTHVHMCVIELGFLSFLQSPLIVSSFLLALHLSAVNVKGMLVLPNDHYWSVVALSDYSPSNSFGTYVHTVSVCLSVSMYVCMCVCMFVCPLV